MGGEGIKHNSLASEIFLSLILKNECLMFELQRLWQNDQNEGNQLGLNTIW